MAIAPAATSSFDAARASSSAAAPVFGMSTEDPTTQPYRQEAEMSFGDFLDIINPLQHIPIISSIYREITGDTIGQPARVMGGFLYGGPLGGMGAVVNVMVEDATGKDIGDQLLSAMSGDSGTPAAQRLSSQPIALTPQGEAAQKLAAQQAAQQTAQQPAAPPAQSAPPAAPAQTAAAPVNGKAAAPAQVAPAQVAPAQVAPAQTAQAPAAPHGAGLATSALMTRNNAAPLSAERSQELQEQLRNGQYHPSRMPARDTVAASTVQAKHAASLAARQWAGQGGAVPPSIAVAAGGDRAASASAAGKVRSTAPTTASIATAASATAASANAALAAAAAQAQPAASAASTAAAPTTAAQAPAAAGTAPSPLPNGPTPVPPDMLSDVMMRNLAKYEAAKKALNPTPPVIRTN